MDTRPEDELILCCARTRLDNQRIERIRSLLQEGIDWPYLNQMARRHSLVPLLYRNLKFTCPDALSNPIPDQLRRYYLANTRRSLLLTEDLLRLLHLFEVHGIPAIPYKGLALAAHIYGDITLRQFSDLDILIHREDVLKARDLLLAQGYRPPFPMTEIQEAAYLQSQFWSDYFFRHEDGIGFIDIHWAIGPRGSSPVIDPDHLWKRLEQVSVNGQTVLTISSEDMILLLCMHGAKHRWQKLNWVCDLAELMELRQEKDWGRIMDRACRQGNRRAVSLGFILAADLLGARLPEEVLQRMEKDTGVKCLAERVKRNLFLNGINRNMRFEDDLLYLRTMDHWADRGRYCLNLLVTPTPLEFSLFPLPRDLFFLYCLIRPLRLTGKYGYRLLRHINPN